MREREFSVQIDETGGGVDFDRIKGIQPQVNRAYTAFCQRRGISEIPEDSPMAYVLRQRADHAKRITKCKS